MSEHSSFWSIAILYRDEEHNSQETTKEEDPKNKDSLGNRPKDVMHLFANLLSRSFRLSWG